ncbi:MAG: cytochrome C [Burkholderiales bacterium]|nr:cytochrome C [Burkholderiales bacterium]
MKLNFWTAAACAAIALPAMAADVSYRADVAPLLKAQCAECHFAAAGAPTLQEFDLAKEKFTKDKTGPRLDTYETLVALIAYPDSGAFMRRLDDGTSQYAGGKPGNMYKYLGETDAERAKNLATLKAWLGQGGWNLNRWKARGDVPAVTKEQVDKLVLKY